MLKVLCVCLHVMYCVLCLLCCVVCGIEIGIVRGEGGTSYLLGVTVYSLLILTLDNY